MANPTKMTEADMLAILEDIQKDVKTILARSGGKFYPVADLPLIYKGDYEWAMIHTTLWCLHQRKSN